MGTLAELEVQLKQLNAKFAEANAELTALSDEAQLMERRLAAASKLIVGLSSEKERWARDIDSLQSKTVRLVGDCLLGASFLSYLGVFTSRYRRELLDDAWVTDLRERGVPLSDDFRVEQLLTTDVEVQRWSGEGLPGDGLAFGCLSETLLLGFDGRNRSFSRGRLSPDRVEETLRLAELYGFELGDLIVIDSPRSIEDSA